MMDSSSEELALEKAYVLRNKVNAWSEKHSTKIPLTLSIGIAVAYTDIDFKKLYENADLALYKAKKLGKDQAYIEKKKNN